MYFTRYLFFFFFRQGKTPTEAGFVCFLVMSETLYSPNTAPAALMVGEIRPPWRKSGFLGRFTPLLQTKLGLWQGYNTANAPQQHPAPFQESLEKSCSRYERHPKMPSDFAASPKPMVNAGHDIQGIIFLPKSCSVMLHSDSALNDQFCTMQAALRMETQCRTWKIDYHCLRY